MISVDIVSPPRPPRVNSTLSRLGSSACGTALPGTTESSGWQLQPGGKDMERQPSSQSGSVLSETCLLLRAPRHRDEDKNEALGVTIKGPTLNLDEPAGP